MLEIGLIEINKNEFLCSAVAFRPKNVISRIFIASFLLTSS